MRTLAPLALLFVIACTEGRDKDTGDELPDVLGQCDSDQAIAWADVQPIFAAYCTSCHASDLPADERQDAPIGVDYDTAETARLNADLTWQMIRYGMMPLYSEMAPEDAMLVWEWLNCGGPE